MQVNIKQELINLDYNDFMAVSQLVDKIIFDLSDLLLDMGDEVMLAAVKDYMIDLINPKLLDFDSSEPWQHPIPMVYSRCLANDNILSLDTIKHTQRLIYYD